MPELPEVETIKNQIKSELIGKCLTSIEVLDHFFLRKQRFLNFDLLVYQKVKDILRKGKYLLFYFESHGLLWHLGLTGNLILLNKALNTPDLKFLRLVLHFEDRPLGYFDVRKFGKIRTFELSSIPEEIKSLGLDAYEISLKDFGELVRRSRKNLKVFLLEQRYVAGLGNIYVDEILFRAGLSPKRTTHSLSDKEILKLFEAMKRVLKEAIFLRGSSVRDFFDAEGRPGEFQKRHLVYGKRGSPCAICNTPLSYEKIMQRGTTFCKVCQQ